MSEGKKFNNLIRVSPAAKVELLRIKAETGETVAQIVDRFLFAGVPDEAA